MQKLSGITLMVATLLSASVANADIRIWEEEHIEGESPDRWFDLHGYLQPGFIWRQNDDNSPNEKDEFWVQRARFGFNARIEPWLQAKLELETAGANAALLDAYVDLRLHQLFNVRMGQYKYGFLRTFQFSDATSAFIDRGLYVPQSGDRDSLSFLKARDVGLMFMGKVGDVDSDAHTPVLEYWAGAFLGQGTNQTGNADDAFMYALRLALHVFGPPQGAEHEGDLANNDYPRAMVAGGLFTNCDSKQQWIRGFTNDLEFRYKGLFLSGQFAWFRAGGASGFANALGYEDDKCGGVEGLEPYQALGAAFQAQYAMPLVDRHSIEFLGRFDYVEPNDSDASPDAYTGGDVPPERLRLTVGLNYYPTSRPNLKVALNYQHNRELEDVVSAEGNIVGIKNDVLWIQLTAGL